SDVEQLADLERELFPRDSWSPPMIAEELRAPGRSYFVATQPGPFLDGPEIIVGWAGIWFDGEDAQIMTISVTRPAQGRGNGAALLVTLIEQAKQLGARRMLLEVRTDNDRAIGLYERFGFTRMGIRRRYYQPEGADAL